MNMRFVALLSCTSLAFASTCLLSKIEMKALYNSHNCCNNDCLVNITQCSSQNPETSTQFFTISKTYPAVNGTAAYCEWTVYATSTYDLSAELAGCTATRVNGSLLSTADWRLNSSSYGLETRSNGEIIVRVAKSSIDKCYVFARSIPFVHAVYRKHHCRVSINNRHSIWMW